MKRLPNQQSILLSRDTFQFTTSKSGKTRAAFGRLLWICPVFQKRYFLRKFLLIFQSQDGGIFELSTWSCLAIRCFISIQNPKRLDRGTFYLSQSVEIQDKQWGKGKFRISSLEEACLYTWEFHQLHNEYSQWLLSCHSSNDASWKTWSLWKINRKNFSFCIFIFWK